MDWYAVDLGCKEGGALDGIIRASDPGRCLGVDARDYSAAIKAKGYAFLRADITSSGFGWPTAEVYCASHILEHLPTVDDSVRVVEMMIARSRKVIIRIPSFDDAILRRGGLRFAWTEWTGHPARVAVADVVGAALAAKGVIEALSVPRRIFSSDSEWVVPAASPIDTVKYDPALGERPKIEFPRGIPAEYEIVIAGTA